MMTDSFKQGVLAEVECAWQAYDCKECCNNDIYQFVDDGEYEKHAFWNWICNECDCYPDMEDVIENANRIQMIRDAYLEMSA